MNIPPDKLNAPPTAPRVVLPHRGRAVLTFAALAGLCAAAAGLGALALRAELFATEQPEAELVTVLAAALAVASAVAAAAAWKMGAEDLARMKAGTMDPAGRWLTRLGLWPVRLGVLAAAAWGGWALTAWLIDLWRTYVLP